MATVSELRLLLRDAGFNPVACIAKRPVQDGWQNKINLSDGEILAMPGANTGILTADTPAFDIDIMHPEAAAAVEDLIKDRFDGRGLVLVRMGNPPKRALLFRTDRPFIKMIAHFKSPNGDKHKVELLGAGQQIIVDGIHPDTRQPYSWPGGVAPWTINRNDLPEITEQEARDLLDSIAYMLHEQFEFERVQANGGDYTNGADGAAFVVRSEEYWTQVVHEGADDGARNDTAASLVGRLFRSGVPPRDAFDFMLWWDQRRNRPSLGEKKIKATVASIARKEMARRMRQCD
jgi:hypothetical protein